MDTINYQQIQGLPGTNPYELFFNFIINFVFTYKILMLIVSIFFLMELIKYFSESTKYSFELNKKLYGGVTIVLLIVIDLLLNGFTQSIKLFFVELLLVISPVFVLYNIALKQLGEYLRKKFSIKQAKSEELG